MDRGANGGVTGSDVKVIETHTDRKVDMRGVNNHKIYFLPLVTAGGVIATATGEVIVSIRIMVRIKPYIILLRPINART